MEPESSLPYSQATATIPYREPNSPSPHNPFLLSWRSILILSSHLRLGLPNGLFPSGFPTKTLCTPLPSSIRAPCPAHLILLDFITRKILGEEYRSLSSLCNILHSPVTPSLLSPNILNTLFSNNLLVPNSRVKQSKNDPANGTLLYEDVQQTTCTFLSLHIIKLDKACSDNLRSFLHVWHYVKYISRKLYILVRVSQSRRYMQHRFRTANQDKTFIYHGFKPEARGPYK